MQTGGIDLAAQDANTAWCRVAWQPGSARIDELRVGCSDQDLIEGVSGCDATGIDAPIGWPLTFVAAVAVWSDGGPWPNVSETGEEFVLRRTDIVVRDSIGRRPMSVAADKIAIPAMRAVRLLTRLDTLGIGPVDRAGSGPVCEIYPGAVLDRWELPSRRYKRAGPESLALRNEIADALIGGANLDIDSDTRHELTRTDHALDALVAALGTRAVAVGLTDPIPASERDAAAVEGWIHLPRHGSLTRLVAMS